MKRALLLAALLLSITAISGCFGSSATYTDRAPGVTTEDARAFSLFGLIGPDKPFRADQLCPSGVANVDTFASIGNMVLSCVTLNVYSPRTVQVTCAAGGAHNFYLNEQDELVAHEFIDDQTGQSVVEDFSSDVF